MVGLVKFSRKRFGLIDENRVSYETIAGINNITNL
jgi:hypothetical protein